VLGLLLGLRRELAPSEQLTSPPQTLQEPKKEC
jgi:hypothetical protein